jgi:DNA-binding GntR family transcriptional regulator
LSIKRAEEAMRAESLSRKPDLPRAVELNKTFHFAVYEAAHSPILMEIIRALWLKAGPVINLDLRANPERLAKGDAIRFHANVRKAIAAGDEAAAQAGIAADISGAAEVILSRGGLAG